MIMEKNQKTSTDVLAKLDIEKKAVKKVKSDKKNNKTDAPTNVNAYTFLGYFILIMTFGLFGGWAAYAPLASSAVANGQVVVSSRVKFVQHLEGGIIEKILVKNGDKVKVGDPLVNMDVTQTQSQWNMAKVQLDELLGEESRLLAERDKKNKVSFPRVLLDRKDESQVQKIIEGQKQIFKENRQSIKHELRILSQRADQLKEVATGLDEQIKHAKEQIRIQQEESDRLKTLVDRQLLPRNRYEATKQQMEALKERLSAKVAERAKLDLQVTETEEQKLLTVQRSKKDVVSRLRTVQTQISNLKARLVALDDIIKRRVIVAPSTGVINNIQIHTEGGVVKAGSRLMDIVPLDEGLILKAMIQTVDVDKVHKGLEAMVMFPTFGTTSRLDRYYGKVTYVSADIMDEDKRQEPFYEAYIEINEDSSAQLEKRGFILLPGMPASVYIKTGDRTLLSYLISPLKNRIMNAFNEE